MNLIRKKCCICEKNVGLNRYGIGPNSQAWVCPSCVDKAGGKLSLDFKSLSAEEIKSYVENNGVYLESVPNPSAIFHEDESVLIDLRKISLDLENCLFAVSLLDPSGVSRPLPFSAFDRIEIKASGETLISGRENFYSEAEALLLPEQINGPAKTFGKSVVYPACKICLYLKDQKKPLLILRPIRRDMNPGFPAGKRIADTIKDFLKLVKILEYDNRSY